MQHFTTRSFKPATYDKSTRSFQAVVTTEAPAEVWDWDSWDVIRETLLMDGAIFPDTGKAPLLDSHARDSTKHILGHARNFRVEGSSMIADVFLDDGTAGDAVGRKIENGHLDSLSIGYRVLESRTLHDGQVEVIRGKEFKGPLKVVTKWQLFEVSLTPIGADSKAKIRAMPDTRSLHMDSTQTQTRPDQVPGTRSATEDAVSAERERVSEITDLCAKTGLMEYARRFVADGTSVEQARNAVLDHMARKNPPLGTRGDMFDDLGHVSMGATGSQKREAAIIDGMLMRSGNRLDKPAPGANEFRNMSILDHARNCLNMNGVSPRGLSASETIVKAMNTRSGMMTTGDFPSLLSGYAGKLLRTAYEMAPGTFDQWTVKGSGENFKDLHRIQLSEAPELSEVAEAAEYEYGSLKDHQETFRIKKFGKMLRFSWEALVGDDTSGFDRTAKAFVQSAKRGLNQAVYALLASNPAMSDGENLFSVAHSNLADSGAEPDLETLHAARLAMRTQTGTNSTCPLNVEPAFLVCPAALETVGAQLLNTPAGFDIVAGVGQSNPFFKSMALIADPALDGFSNAAWYLIADPRKFDTIEVAYLEGRDHPYLEEEWSFTSDAWAIKCRFCYGLGILDHRGFFRNPGE